MVDACRTIVDVAIIGAGLAGTVSAMALDRQGFRVALIDARSKHPPEFRAEKFGETEMQLFERYGLGMAARSVATPLDEVWVAQGRRLIEVVRNREYGFSYATLINAMREALPASIRQHVGRVERIHNGPDLQTVALSNGHSIEARLLVIATGLGEGIRRMLGVPTACDFKSHSLSLGFDLAQDLSRFPFRHFTYRSIRLEDRVSYLTLFATGERMRANLFVYKEIGDPWVKDFRRDPTEHLNRLFPDLRRFSGDTTVSEMVDVRPMDLLRVVDPPSRGIVLIGDAYCTTCPTAGAGMNKALIDVSRLCDVYAPSWLSTPGRSVANTANFYADPIKLKSDRRSIAASRELRSFLVEPGWQYRVRRLRSRVYRTGLDLLRRMSRAVPHPIVAGLDSAHPEGRL